MLFAADGGYGNEKSVRLSGDSAAHRSTKEDPIYRSQSPLKTRSAGRGDTEGSSRRKWIAALA